MSLTMGMLASSALQDVTIVAKIWAAGGAGGSFSTSAPGGGSGGYETVTFKVSKGAVIKIVVGQGGRFTGLSAYGGGGQGGYNSPNGGGGGGGYSGLFLGSVSQANAIAISGGGGGAGYYSAGTGGGGGGGNTGGSLSGSSPLAGGGGTQSAGGATGTVGSGHTQTPTAGSALQGGRGATAAGTGAGGGGGGYYGGGGGYSNTSSTAGGGGGGSGYVMPTNANVTVTSSSMTQGTNGPATGNSSSNIAAPNASDADYVAGVGQGGAKATVGGNGLVVLYVDGVKQAFSYTGAEQSITV